jgi:hypothetical protein
LTLSSVAGGYRLFGEKYFSFGVCGVRTLSGKAARKAATHIHWRGSGGHSEQDIKIFVFSGWKTQELAAARSPQTGISLCYTTKVTVNIVTCISD